MSAAGWSSAATDGSSVSAADSDALGVLAELNLGFVVETSAAFYAELEDIVNPAETTLTALDYAIRAYVAFAAQFYGLSPSGWTRLSFRSLPASRGRPPALRRDPARLEPVR